MTDKQFSALSAYDFYLPESPIAQHAIEPRDAARLLHVRSAGLGHLRVRDLPDLLNAGDVLVINDSKVLPARLLGMRGDARVEIFLHKKKENGVWEIFARPLKRLKQGDKIIFSADFFAEFLRTKEDGLAEVALNKTGAELMAALDRYGLMPLPPYIKRKVADAVGTTATRVLESMADANGRVRAGAGETAIFIKPEYAFKIVDCLMTNFHLPKSTLFMLVAAFMGLARMQAVYKEARLSEYRFFSYGDACFLERLS